MFLELVTAIFHLQEKDSVHTLFRLFDKLEQLTTGRRM